MDDIQILKEMLTAETQVRLKQGRGRPSAELTDPNSGASVEITGLPHNAIVIRAENFEEPLTIFQGSKGERKRADFVIVANAEAEKKWIICIETQARDSKQASHVIQQLKGACCFMRYCQYIGQSFWDSEEFLEGYTYRFVSITDINPNKSKRRTQPFQLPDKLHDSPDAFLKISQRSTIHFRKLIHLPA